MGGVDEVLRELHKDGARLATRCPRAPFVGRNFNKKSLISSAG